MSETLKTKVTKLIYLSISCFRLNFFFFYVNFLLNLNVLYASINTNIQINKSFYLRKTYKKNNIFSLSFRIKYDLYFFKMSSIKYNVASSLCYVIKMLILPKYYNPKCEYIYRSKRKNYTSN